MPKDEIDYSNTIIYKIFCKDNDITDTYIGHTTNFSKRKYQHKISCNNLENKLKIYQVIREKGGWDNWDMIEIAKYNCKDHTEARIKEQEHYQLLQSSLNSCPPYVDKTNWFCKLCNLQCSSTKQYDTHVNCNSHKKRHISFGETQKLKKNVHRFFCKSCDFKCYMKCDWERHITRAKHLDSVTGNEGNVKNLKKTYYCGCGKNFMSNSGLWKHKKICNIKEVENKVIDVKDEITDEMSDKDLIIMLVKQNSELLEVIKNGTHNTNISYNNNNSHNKTFNLNVFLNETCKDAMNIMDFVESIKLQLSDLESIGRLGFVEGISNIITTNLKALDVTKRPVHCADNKREVLYVKDDNKWEKEDEHKKKIRKAIKRVATKNLCLIPSFKEAHPDCNRASSKYSDQYNKIIVEACGGSGDNDAEKEDKIIRNIAKLVTIDKKQTVQ